MNTTSSDHYADDAPISAASEDRFSRWSFAERIAVVIAGRKDLSSIVLGIYGPWGDGKTSALNMMNACLVNFPNVVTVRFNPWHFGSDENLIRAFFDTLADAAGKQLSTGGERFGQILKKYGGLLSIASLNLGAAQISTGEAAKSLGEHLSTVELDDIKERLGNVLKESGKRVVVLIDDVDRLDRSEIHTLLKLVKLSASFACTSYVIACDDEMVAASLGDRYGAGGPEAGRQFLEKIIQVPLHLPNAEAEDLQLLAFEGVEDVLKEAGIEITAAEAETFAKNFAAGILPALETPRQVKRYLNSVRFAAPLLKNEVNIVDQLLLEAARVAYPTLYLRIRSHEATYTGRAGILLDKQKDKEKQRTEIEEHLADLAPFEKQAARELIDALFPRTRNSIYGSEWDREWADDRRIASSHYFRRYFQYSVPQRDVPDAVVEALFATSASKDAEALRLLLREIDTKKAWTRALDKMFAALKEDPATNLQMLVTELVRHSDRLPHQAGTFGSWFSPRSRVATFLAMALEKIPEQAVRLELAKALVTDAPFDIAEEFMRWCKADPNDETAKAALSADDAVTVGKALATRIAQALEESTDLSSFGTSLPRMFWLWKEFGPHEKVQQFLTHRIESDPYDGLRFLATFVRRAWNLESGTSQQDDFRREAYEAAASFVEASVILNAIEKVYPGKSEHFSFEEKYDLTGDERIACVFVAIHKKVIAEKELAGKGAE